MKPLTEACETCALKHLSKAAIRLTEARNGYPAEYFFSQGEMSLAEDHLVDKYPGLAAAIREHRKALEAHPDYAVPFKTLVLQVAAQTGYSIDNYWGRRPWRATFMRLKNLFGAGALLLGLFSGVAFGDGITVTPAMIDQSARGAVAAETVRAVAAEAALRADIEFPIMANMTYSGTNLITDASLAKAFRFVLTNDAHLFPPTNAVDGQVLKWWFVQGTGTNKLTLADSYVLPVGTTNLALSVTNGFRDVLVGEYEASTTNVHLTGFMLFER